MIDPSPSAPSPLPTAAVRLRRAIEQGLFHGAQLYASLAGRAVADLALGESAPGEAMAADFLLPWLSATKPATAIAVAQLWETGALDLDDRVALHIPEFGCLGKEAITIRHLLTHGGGFRTVAIGGPRRGWEENIARICRAPLEPGAVPGAQTAYHPASSWYVLGEIVARRSGLAIDRYLRQRIFLPLGMASSSVGISAERAAALRARIAPVYRRGWQRFPWDEAAWLARVSPAENGWGPARELARLYETLLAPHAANVANAANTALLLSAATVGELTAPQSPGGRFDASLRRVVHWGLGLRINAPLAGSARLSAAADFGRHASAAAFGHGGLRSALSFADPAHGLAVALTINGLPAAAEHRRLAAAVAEAVYVDLDLTLEADLALSPGPRRGEAPA